MSWQTAPPSRVHNGDGCLVGVRHYVVLKVIDVR